MSALILFVSGTGSTEGCHYRDSAGVVHFFDDKSQVPDQYRNQAMEANTLPEVNRVGVPARRRQGGSRLRQSPDRKSRT